jgi:hypothetical protein
MEQSGLVTIDGVVCLGVFHTTPPKLDPPTAPLTWPQIEARARQREEEREREWLGARIFVHRAADGVQILYTKRSKIFARYGRIRKMEKARGGEFKFVPLGQIQPVAERLYPGESFFRLPRHKQLQVALEFARGLRYKATDDDLPAFIRSTPPSAFDGFAATPPKPAVAGTPPPRETNPRLVGGVALACVAIFLALALSGHGGLAVLVAYTALATCMVANKCAKRETSNKTV